MLDDDSRFWTHLNGGLTALGFLDTWVAARQLQSISDGLLLPLLTSRLAGTEAQVQQDSRVQSLRTRSAHDGQVASLLHAYGRLAAEYRALRHELGIEHSPLTSLEARAQSLLNNAARQNTATDQVITWRPLSIILPAYNEEGVIEQTVNACLAAVRCYCPNAEIIVVDDGSHDHTGPLIDALHTSDARVIAIHNRPNQGYGGALLAGFAAAQGYWTFFMDGDGQFDIHDLARFLTLAEQQPHTAVLGYRARRRDTMARKLNAWGWKLVARWVVNLSGIRDIDCAFKLIPSQALQACQLSSHGAAVNAEILTKLQRMHVPIVQLPVTHLPRTTGKPTGAAPKVILRAFGEIFRLRQHLRAWQPPALPASP